MKNKALILALILALSLTIPILAKNANAVTVPQNGTNTNNIQWIPAGFTFYNDSLKGFAEQPQFLILTVGAGVPVITNTTVLIDGTDALGQNIEAEAMLNGTSANPLYQEYTQEFIDIHSGNPVAFSSITDVRQQNGTDGNKFMISTWPETGYPIFGQYIGQYHNQIQNIIGYGWYPGVYSPNGLNTPYWVTNGMGLAPSQQNVAFQPQHPEPTIVFVNWHDNNHDLTVDGYQAFPVAGTDVILGASATGTIYVEGLNALGQKLILSHTFSPGEQSFSWDCFAEIDKVWGGNNVDSYYFFTAPMPKVDLFYYFVTLDHMTISPDSYDILAYPGIIGDYYPGVTNVTVTLKDIDGNIINWGGHFANSTYQVIILSFFTSGGEIQPSANVFIGEEQSSAQVNLTADTNPRTITVACDANVPGVILGGDTYHNELNLYVWTEMTFDGVNSHPNTAGWPIHTLQWGYTDAFGGKVTKNAPPKPVLPPELGGPQPNGIKLDGPIYEVSIPLYVGCNLISSPVYPILGTYYHSGYPNPIPGTGSLPSIPINNYGIPMDLLFNYTSARLTIEAIWWLTYPDGTGIWHVYVPGVSSDPNAYFTDGVGYWIKAEKPSTLEISGVAMENGPFTPNTYEVEALKWNLVGFTSVNPMPTSSYLESTQGSTAIQAVGPIWTYNAQSGVWVRDPAMLWPTNAFWAFNKVPTDLYIAP